MVTTGKTPRHFTIPIFIPGVACPFQCIFCDQKKISGSSGIPSIEMVREIINTHLETIPRENVVVEVGFFGGTFTGLPQEKQQSYFDVVLPFIKSGRIESIRISTRPDFISQQILALLKRNFVKTIELGAQSMIDEVLRLSCRGHNSADTEKASKMIIGEGFSLGLQMMIGLPGDTEDFAIITAQRIVDLKANETRIYPTLVISGTALANLFITDNYHPLELEDAVRWTKNVVRIFEPAPIKILRIGLHPSEELVNTSSLLAGPFHPSFRELVMTEIWYDRFHVASFTHPHNFITIHVNPNDYNYAIGYSGKNRKFFESQYNNVKFIADPEIQIKNYHVDYR